MKKTFVFIVIIFVGCLYSFTQGIAYAQGSPLFGLTKANDQKIISPIPSTIPSLTIAPSITPVPTIANPTPTQIIKKPVKLLKPTSSPVVSSNNANNIVRPSPTASPTSTPKTIVGATRETKQKPPTISTSNAMTSAQKLANQTYSTLFKQPLSILNRAFPENYYMDKSLSRKATLLLITIAIFCIGFGAILIRGGMRDSLMKKL